MDVREFATTLVCAVSDARATATAHIGDGAVLGRAPSGDWTALSWPEQGEYAATTYFVTDEGPPRLRLALHPAAVDALVVTTDGLERLALDFAGRRPHAPFLDAVVAPVAAASGAGRAAALSGDLGRFLGSGRVAERTDDDTTLIVAVHH